VAGGAQQLAGAVADDDARGLGAVARRERLAQGAGGRVGVRVDGAAQGERGRVDDLRVRRLVPGGGGEVQRWDLGQLAGALLVAALAQVAAELLRRELVELPVVVEEARCQRSRLTAGRTSGPDLR
jgi:hypothetical protein